MHSPFPSCFKNSNLGCRVGSTVLRKLCPQIQLVKIQSRLQDRRSLCPISSKILEIKRCNLSYRLNSYRLAEQWEDLLASILGEATQGRASACQLHLQADFIWVQFLSKSAAERTLLLTAALAHRKDVPLHGDPAHQTPAASGREGLLVSLPVLCHWFLHEVLECWLFTAFLCNCRRKGRCF